MKKKIMLAAGLIFLLAGYAGYKIWNKPHQDIAAADSFMTISAIDLLKAFQEDETGANARFLNKVLTIDGVIRQVRMGENLPTLDLNTSDELASVICNLDPFAKHPSVDFSVGQEIRIKGKCSGMLNDVIIDRCVVVE
jgi:hypothetical protein